MRVCQRLAAKQERILVLIWDNVLCHISREVRARIRTYNQREPTAPAPMCLYGATSDFAPHAHELAVSIVH
jgi:hypothetical protein